MAIEPGKPPRIRKRYIHYTSAEYDFATAFEQAENFHDVDPGLWRAFLEKIQAHLERRLIIVSTPYRPQSNLTWQRLAYERLKWQHPEWFTVKFEHPFEWPDSVAWHIRNGLDRKDDPPFTPPTTS